MVRCFKSLLTRILWRLHLHMKIDYVIQNTKPESESSRDLKRFPQVPSMPCMAVLCICMSLLFPSLSSANCFGVPDFCVPFGVLNELIEPLSSMCTMEGFCTTQSRQQIEDVCRVRTAWRKVGCKIFLLLSNYRGIKSKFPEARFPWCVAYCYCTDCSRTWHNFLRFHMPCHDVNENQSWL